MARARLMTESATCRGRSSDWRMASQQFGRWTAPDECNAPWVSTVIETDGTVRPCFFQPALGNVRAAGSLGAVLNSAEAIAWRRQLDVHRNAICAKCVCTLSLGATAPA